SRNARPSASSPTSSTRATSRSSVSDAGTVTPSTSSTRCGTRRRSATRSAPSSRRSRRDDRPTVTDRAKELGSLVESLRVDPGSTVALGSDFDPGFTPDRLKNRDADDRLQATTEALAEYQQRLAAQSTYGLLVVL